MFLKLTHRLLNMKTVLFHQVVNAGYRAVGAVFDRKNTIVTKSLVNRSKNAGKVVEIHYFWDLKQLFTCML